MIINILKFAVSYAFPMEFTMIPDYDNLADSIELTAKHFATKVVTNRTRAFN